MNYHEKAKKFSKYDEPKGPYGGEVVRVISVHKYIPKSRPVSKGCQRVEAIIRKGGELITRHVDVPIKQ